MAATLKDLERRVIALEKAAERDRSVERAVAEVVAASEKRFTDKVTALERAIDRRFNEAGAQMERIIEMLGKLTPRS